MLSSTVGVVAAVGVGYSVLPLQALGTRCFQLVPPCNSRLDRQVSAEFVAVRSSTPSRLTVASSGFDSDNTLVAADTAGTAVVAVAAVTDNGIDNVADAATTVATVVRGSQETDPVQQAGILPAFDPGTFHRSP